MQQPQHTDSPKSFVWALVNLCHFVEDGGLTISFQLVPSQSCIPSNKRAEALTAACHAMDPSVFVNRFVEVLLITQDRMLRHHPDDDVARGRPPMLIHTCNLTWASGILVHLIRTKSSSKH